MEQKKIAVRLIRNHLYASYQLYALMANKKTSPQEGLRLAALTTMQWLRDRLGENVPPELQQPGPECFRECIDETFPSFHINSGFIIDIVSLPREGVWSLQITEPDLGSDPGNPQQARQAVPGRVIETNIGFHIAAQSVECGFKTVISDPEGVERDAEVYCLAVVRRLIRNPDFGLRQLTSLVEEPQVISTVEQLKSMWDTQRHLSNQLPCVVFTYARKDVQPTMPAKPLTVLSGPISGLETLPMGHSKFRPAMPEKKEAKIELAYDVAKFAHDCVGFCRTYVVEDKLFERFNSLTKAAAESGDIVLFHPSQFGMMPQVFPYKPSKKRQEEAMEVLRALTLTYPRRKDISFGQVCFLTGARKLLVQSAGDARMESEQAEQRRVEGLIEAEIRWGRERTELKRAAQELGKQLRRQKAYTARVETEKAGLLRQLEKQARKYESKLHDEDEYVAFLQRKLDYPNEHREIEAWVRKYFSDRLYLHPKAAALLVDRSAQEVDLELICDALDYLATDYWEQRYFQVPKDVAMTRCSRKYGRPFEIKPTGTTTIEFTPAQYKVKYFPGAAGKPVESALDYHLGVGNDPESLLRIYFLHDDGKKLIVIGSLPKHLRAVTIK